MGAKAFRLLNTLPTINYSDLAIVEVGSDRGEGSTEFLANFAYSKNLSFYTVDLDPFVYESNRRLCETFGRDDIVAYNMSGEDFFRNAFPPLKRRIYFLYLDNFDFIFDAIKGKDWVHDQILSYQKLGLTLNNSNSRRAHFLQSLFALPFMNSKSHILFDDTFKLDSDRCWDGKGGDAIVLLENLGWKLTHCNPSPNEQWLGYAFFSSPGYD